MNIYIINLEIITLFNKKWFYFGTRTRTIVSIIFSALNNLFTKLFYQFWEISIEFAIKVTKKVIIVYFGIMYRVNFDVLEKSYCNQN